MSNHVYKLLEVTGSSPASIEDAVSTAIAKAHDCGIAAVSAVACNHIGRVGEWVEMAATDRLIGFATVSMYGLGLAAAPHGGAERAMSTNPIAFG